MMGVDVMPFGETFADELAAAGLGDKGLSWSADADAVIGASALTPAAQTSLAAVIAAHDPARRRAHAVSKVAIIRRLQAAAKFDAALAALRADPLLYELWSAVTSIRSDDTQARALFVSVGVDPDAVLAPDP